MRQANIVTSTISNTHLASLSITPQPVGTDKFENVTVVGNTAYACCGATSPTIVRYDVTNPLAPVQTGIINAGGTYDCMVQGNYLYFGGSGSTFVYVATLQPTFQVIATYNVTSAGGGCYSVVANGNYIYVATQKLGLTVLDASSLPTLTQTYQEGGTLNKSVGVCIGQANTVYTTNFDTAGTHVVKYLKTWDISNPAVPTLINTYTFAANIKCGGVEFFNNMVFVTNLDNGTVYILDVTNRAAPVLLSTMPTSAGPAPGMTPGISTLFPGKVLAYLGTGGDATRGAAIDVYDITTPSAPVLLQTVWSNVAGSAGGPATVANNYVYVANYGVAPGAAGTFDIHSSTTVYTTPILSTNLIASSISSMVSDTSTNASISMQASNDVNLPGINFSNVSATITNITGSNGLILIPKINLSYEQIRMSYNTLGTGSITAQIKVLGD